MTSTHQNILLVEDDPDVAEVIRFLLMNEGYLVQHASNGVVALELLRDGPAPSLILLDLMMPVMDGWQFRAEQRRDPALAEIPTVIMTGAGETAREHLLDHERVVHKPVDLHQLLALVARLC